MRPDYTFGSAGSKIGLAVRNPQRDFVIADHRQVTVYSTVCKRRSEAGVAGHIFAPRLNILRYNWRDQSCENPQRDFVRVDQRQVWLVMARSTNELQNMLFASKILHLEL